MWGGLEPDRKKPATTKEAKDTKVFIGHDVKCGVDLDHIDED